MAEAAKGEKTKYVVLRKAVGVVDGVQATFEQLPGVFQESNADQATRKAAEKHGAGEYVATPVRSFRPDVYKVENHPRVVRVRTPQPGRA